MASTIPWNKIKVLSFDIYGTLIDWENGIAAAARATALGPHLPKEHRDLMLGIERHDTTVQKEFPTMKQTGIIAEGLRRYAQELGVVAAGHLTQDQVDEACADYGGRIGEYPAFSDSVAAMQSLAKHYKLVPLSNVDVASFQRSLEGPLKGCRFDAVYTAEDIGSYKPNLRNFEYLLEHVQKDFGAEKGELCHVAQSLFHDHAPATEMGITQNVWIDRKGFMGAKVGGAEEKAQYSLKCDSLGELAEVVEQALGA